jgi:cold shock CspA family protein
LYGVIVQWFPAKLFGFIRPTHGSDVFFHANSIGGCQPMEIQIGQPVQYELEPAAAPLKTRRTKEDLLDGPPPKPKAAQAKLVEFIEKIPGKIIDIAGDNSRVEHHPKARRKKPNWRG